jgi:molybdopterin-guanine dinucleotide biosynthesis protein A
LLKINNKSKYIAVAILIGGRSTRFGSDKGLFPLFGKPLISHQLDVLSSFNYDIFLIARSKQQVQNYIHKIDLKKIMAFIIDDNELIINTKERSPIIGLYSAFKELSNLAYKKTFVLPCDLPLIQKKVIEFLLSQPQNYDCCIPIWSTGFLEPLLAIYTTKQALISTEENIKSENYKLVNIIDKNWNINYISVEKSLKPLDPNLLTFININSKEELEKIKKKVKKY